MTYPLVFRAANTAVCLSLVLGMSACSDAFDDDDAEVRSVEVSETTLRVGQETGVDVNFQFDEGEVLREGDDVEIAVLIPAGLQYVEGSAEIDGVFSNPDVDPIGIPCPDGSALQIFDLDDDDLDSVDDPSGSADARLEFDIVGVSEVAGASVEARADYNNTSATCSSAFRAQSSDLVNVIP